jgi:hypothetical protein
MTLNEAQNQFALRLYDWSLKDFIRELDQGCPLLSLTGLNHRWIASFVGYARLQPKSERDRLARLLVRYGHENAVNLRRQPLSRQEQDEISEFRQKISAGTHQLPPLVSADYRQPTFEDVDPIECMDLVREAIPSSLGKQSRSRLKVTAALVIGDWKLLTEFWFYKRDTFLSCEYQFVRKDGSPIIGIDKPYPRNLFMFYGLHSTMAFVPSRADALAMAPAIVKVGSHFVAQAAPLFDGLGIND